MPWHERLIMTSKILRKKLMAFGNYDMKNIASNYNSTLH
jgi:hypothetical protein